MGVVARKAKRKSAPLSGDLGQRLERGRRNSVARPAARGCFAAGPPGWRAGRDRRV